ncbi:MAG TPA: CRISPR-associated endoribonuclease Cas6 [Saprospiraceae bacterium]|nr:CRISPR-associated endoribonuclease Cas6 [Saprospiraceae bacterium]
MELKINFINQKPLTIIPIDYQYYLSSWLYGIMKEGDAQYATFLHDQGYASDKAGKFFKLFCFSNLQLQDFQINKQNATISVKGENLSMKLRFLADDAVENFVKGLFINQKLALKNGFNSMAEFDVNMVSTKRVEVDKERVRIKMLSPLVLSTKDDRGMDQYAHPLDEGYEGLFFRNLLDKYSATGQDFDPTWQNATMSLEIMNQEKIKSKLVMIKGDTKQETRVRGFLFDFILVAPKALIEVGLLGGFGKECGMGFGFGEVDILSSII